MRFMVAIQGGAALILAAGVAAHAQVHAPGHGVQPLSGVQAPLVKAQAPEVNPNTMLVQYRTITPKHR
ncbi:MAG: hypothetical protein JJT95_13935 [Pararhodobacter sp.]|nr:hypothetical protein [Pararhodobacter sp.]